MPRISRGRRLYADVLEIGGKAGTDTRLLGRSVYGDEDEVCLTDALVDIGGEEEVASAGLADDVLEAGLVDGEVEVGRVPRVDTRLVKVDDGDLDVGALEGDDGARWASNVSRADYGDASGTRVSASAGKIGQV